MHWDYNNSHHREHRREMLHLAPLPFLILDWYQILRSGAQTVLPGRAELRLAG